MKNFLKISFFLFLASNSDISSAETSCSNKNEILVVDLERIEVESEIGKNVREKVERYMLSIRHQMEQLEKLAESLQQKNKKYDSSLEKKIKISDFNFEKFKNTSQKDRHLMLYALAQKKSAKVNEITKQVSYSMQNFFREQIKCIAKAKKATLVLDNSVIFYGESVSDITDEVINLANKKSNKFKFPKELCK